MIAAMTLKTCCCSKRPVTIEEDDPIEICRHCGGARPTKVLTAMRAREYKRRLTDGTARDS